MKASPDLDWISLMTDVKGRTIKKLMGGGGAGAGEVQKNIRAREN